MTQPDDNTWFRDYVVAYNRSLDGDVQIETIRSYYAETVIALGIDGSLSSVTADSQAIDPVLEQLFEFYVSIGMRRLNVERVEASPLHENHDRVQVFYAGEYEKPDGSPVIIPYNVVYLIQRRPDRNLIFAFITGDETALYEQYGLLDADGPTAGVA